MPADNGKNELQGSGTPSEISDFSSGSDFYKTVKNASSAQYSVKRSRFIGSIAPVKTGEEAVDFINSVKHKYWDATHNVYAYVLRDGQLRRYSDDGEPQGTAGMPVLDVLLKEKLTDCAVVVTRYFGGIMLGAGGLVRAYSHAAKLAVNAGEVVTMQLCTRFELDCGYDFFGKVPSVVSDFAGRMGDVQYLDAVKAEIYVPSEQLSGFCKAIKDLSSGKYDCRVTGERYCAID